MNWAIQNDAQRNEYPLFRIIRNNIRIFHHIINNHPFFILNINIVKINLRIILLVFLRMVFQYKIQCERNKTKIQIKQPVQKIHVSNCSCENDCKLGINNVPKIMENINMIANLTFT